MKSHGFWEGVIYGQGMRLAMLSDVQWHLRPLATVQEAPEKPVQERPLPPQTPLVPKGDFQGRKGSLRPCHP